MKVFLEDLFLTLCYIGAWFMADIVSQRTSAPFHFVLVWALTTVLIIRSLRIRFQKQ